jgi:hypothetical protein
MTTQREIKKWVAPILRKRRDLGMGYGCIVLKPVHHLLRGVFIWRTSIGDLPRIGWFLDPIFENPSPSMSIGWSNDVHIGHSSSDGFVERLTGLAEDAITGILSPIETVEDFFIDTTENPHKRKRLGSWKLNVYPREHGSTLAALGRLKEARAVLVPWVTENEAIGLAELAEGQALLAKRPNSGSGKDKLRWGEGRLRAVARLRHLVELADAGDRAGIGALLREWEQVSVKTWGVEHLYESTPFPVEEGAGD